MGKKKRFYRKIPLKRIRKANRRRPASSLELKVQSWLEADDITFKPEYPVGLCHVDIFLPPKTLIELQGCFWHRHNSCYRPVTPRQKAIQTRDAKRHAFLKSQGYTLEVIWECEVNDHPRKTRRRLRKLARREAC